MATLQTASRQTASSAKAGDMKELDYSVHSQAEICFFLNGVMQEKSLISLHLSTSSHSIILSSILAIDLEKKLLILDYGINETLNQIALKRGSLRCTTSHNRIRIEFDCNNLQHIRFEGRHAFSADIPESLKRLQRRNFYRVITPITNPAVCVVPSLGSHEAEPVAYNLLDISCGGMALIDQPDTDTLLQAGMVLEHCRVDLPGNDDLFGSIETTIRIAYVGTVILNNGNTCPRIGCEFIDLPEKSRILVQRYIAKVEQQARKLETESGV